MLKKVRDYVNKWHMLQKEDRVIVGVSGGADSVCLLFVLLELQKEIGFDIVVVHVNHGLRGEAADADEAYVKNICADHGIACECYFENIELIAKKRKQSTEEAGREIRRSFFEQAAKTHQGTKIALAHHKNDNAETFFLNLARGTGLKGLKGIVPMNGKVIRPLLCVEREEIETYLEEKHIFYCIDQTNKSDAYTRNRIRNHVIPYMEQNINDKTVEHMSDTMEQIRQIENYLEEQVKQLWEGSVLPTETGYMLAENTYQGIPDALKPMLIKKMLVAVSGREKDLEAIHIRQVQELFHKQTGRKVDLPYQMEGKRIYEGVVICLKEEKGVAKAEQVFGYVQGETGEINLGEQIIRYRVVEQAGRMQNTLEKSNTKWFDYDIIKSNLCFRTRQAGDYLTIHSDGGTQKLKSYFINEKIPQEERGKIPLLADGNHVVWIVGHRVNPLYQIHENTKRILEIQIDEGESYVREN